VTIDPGPESNPTYRVPRSVVDTLYSASEDSPAIRIGSGFVVSIDGDTCTVLIGDDEIPGVVWLGVVPKVGDLVEVWQQDDLLTIPADIDAYLEGMEEIVAHIVSDDDPGKPSSEEWNVAGSMRDPDFWYFNAGVSGLWQKEEYGENAGLRVYEKAGALLARNLVTVPNFETGKGAWASNSVFGGAVLSTLAVVADPAMSGSQVLEITWPTMPTGDGAAKSSNALLLVTGLTVGTQYSLSMRVFVPSGASNVYVDSLFWTGAQYVTERDQWVRKTVNFTAGQTQAFVGLSSNSVVAGTKAYIDDVLMVVTAGTTLPPDNPYFDGDTPSTAEAAFQWTGTRGASSSSYFNGSTGLPATGILWSTETFEVETGDLIDVEIGGAVLAGIAPSVQVVMLYGTDQEDAPDVGDTNVQQVDDGTVVNTAGVLSLVSTVTVPIELTTTAGLGTPAIVRFGLKFTGDGAADVVISKVVLHHTAKRWPIGSTWYDPSAAVGGVPTATASVTSTASTIATITATPTVWARAPGFKKVVIAAPPYSGGVVMLYAGVGIGGTAPTATLGIDLAFNSNAAGAKNFALVRIYQSVSTGINMQVPITGLVQIAAGETIECWIDYRYVSAPPSAYSFRAPYVQAVFIPGGVVAGELPNDPMIRYFDGDSWRPAKNDAAGMDATIDGTVLPSGLTITNTTVSRSASSIHAGNTLTLTATIDKADATGTVTFYKGTTASGPWTSLGSSTAAGGKATKAYTTSRGTWYFRAIYGGSTKYVGSTSANNISTVATVTTTKVAYLTQTWSAGYTGGGANFTSRLVQGNAPSTNDGNRRSLIGLSAVPTEMRTSSNIRLVEIIGQWTAWLSSDNRGTLRFGWHSNSSEPTKFTVGSGSIANSGLTTSEVAVVQTTLSWGPTALRNAAFRGLVIGPGYSDALEYAGSTASGDLRLRVTYDVEIP
jgi:hypothetical protein